MPIRVSLLALLAMALFGCVATNTVDIEHFDACPDTLEPGINLTAFSRPLRSAAGTLQRRIVVTAAQTYAQRGTRIVWSRLSIRSLGGNFLSWSRLKTNRGPRDESNSVSYSPGQLIVTRETQTGVNLAGSVMLDAALTPGGITVDDTVMRIPKLWESRTKPLAAQDLQIELLPVRHAPGYDGIEALINLDYIVQNPRQHREWSCSAQAHALLVDRDEVRPPYWDLGVSQLNAGRKYWLALFDESHGILRALFESPAAANAFATWIRASGSDKAGSFTLGLFDGTQPKSLRPFVPVDKTAFDTFRPLLAAEAKDLRVGPLGQP
jgi:hypothetical protein